MSGLKAEALNGIDVESYIPLAMKLAQKFFFGDSSDPQEEALLALVKAATTFEPDKGWKFITYASHVIFNRLSDCAKESQKHKNVLSLDLGSSHDLFKEYGVPGKEKDKADGFLTLAELISTGDIFEGINDRLDTEKSFQIFLNTLNDQEYRIVELRCSHAKSHEIMEQLHISQPTLSRKMRAIRAKFDDAFCD